MESKILYLSCDMSKFKKPSLFIHVSFIKVLFYSIFYYYINVLLWLILIFQTFENAQWEKKKYINKTKRIEHIESIIMHEFERNVLVFGYSNFEFLFFKCCTFLFDITLLLLLLIIIIIIKQIKYVCENFQIFVSLIYYICSGKLPT